MIPAVILAAGLSTRMGGRSKALLRLPDGRTFVDRLVSTLTAAGVADIVVVLGHDADAVRASLPSSPAVRPVINADYRSGQFSSVLAGLAAAERPGVEAILLTLVDVPLVSQATVRAVVERFRATGAPIVRPVCGGQHGHPVLISRALFPLLRAADETQGAKPVVRAHVSVAGDVEVSDAHAFRDVDTPPEYAALLSDDADAG